MENLKICKPSTWWNEVKKLSGCSPTSSTYRDFSKSLQHQYGSLNETSLANAINEAFLLPMHDYTPLQYHDDPVFNASLPDEILVVSTDSVFVKLSKLNSNKANGPDNLPAWVLKENADVLAEAVSDILNCSYREGKLPIQWKEANVIPVPKQKPVKDINNHLRPISLTPILSKIAEEYVVDRYVKPSVLKNIDPQ